MWLQTFDWPKLCHQEVVIGDEGCGTDGVVVPGSLGGCTRIDMYRWSRQAPTDTIECWKLPVAIYAPDIAYRRENNLTAKNRRAWQVIRHIVFFAVKGSFPNTLCTRSEPHTRTYGVKTSHRCHNLLLEYWCHSDVTTAADITSHDSRELPRDSRRQRLSTRGTKRKPQPQFDTFGFESQILIHWKLNENTRSYSMRSRDNGRYIFQLCNTTDWGTTLLYRWPCWNP